jgi:hypothetical protein
VIQLDRAVTDRIPLAVSYEANDVLPGQNLELIGYPNSESMKLDLGGTARDAGPTWFFEADVDAMPGNSGSPVMDKATGVVLGVLVAGHAPYRLGSHNHAILYPFTPLHDVGFRRFDMTSDPYAGPLNDRS